MKDYLIEEIRNSRSFGEFLGNLIWLSQSEDLFKKFVEAIVTNWWPATTDKQLLDALLLDLSRRFECWASEEPNRFWTMIDVKDSKAVVGTSPLSADSFYAPDYDAALEHCIVVLEIKPELLL